MPTLSAPKLWEVIVGENATMVVGNASFSWIRSFVTGKLVDISRF